MSESKEETRGRPRKYHTIEDIKRHNKERYLLEGPSKGKHKYHCDVCDKIVSSTFKNGHENSKPHMVAILKKMTDFSDIDEVLLEFSKTIFKKYLPSD